MILAALRTAQTPDYQLCNAPVGFDDLPAAGTDNTEPTAADGAAYELFRSYMKLPLSSSSRRYLVIIIIRRHAPVWALYSSIRARASPATAAR